MAMPTYERRHSREKMDIEIKKANDKQESFAIVYRDKC